jgi:hypothetical protein
MKVFIEQNMYKVIQDKQDAESAKYFVAQHAVDHLNELLRKNPDLRCNKLYAAEYPISLRTMSTWMGTVFGHYWKRNKKGIANQVHERTDAVQQRIKYIYDNKWRQYQNLVWHHERLDRLQCMMPHMYDLALISKRVDLETNLIEKKLADNVQAELLHNVHVYLRHVPRPCGTRRFFPAGQLEEIVEVKVVDEEWVEMHVDFLDVRDRQDLYPFWGGALSTRCNLQKVLFRTYNFPVLVICYCCLVIVY